MGEGEKDMKGGKKVELWDNGRWTTTTTTTIIYMKKIKIKIIVGQRECDGETNSRENHSEKSSQKANKFLLPTFTI